MARLVQRRVARSKREQLCPSWRHALKLRAKNRLTAAHPRVNAIVAPKKIAHPLLKRRAGDKKPVDFITLQGSNANSSWHDLGECWLSVNFHLGALGEPMQRRQQANKIAQRPREKNRHTARVSRCHNRLDLFYVHFVDKVVARI